MNKVIVSLCLIGGIVPGLSQHGAPWQVTGRKLGHCRFSMILKSGPWSQQRSCESRAGNRTNRTVRKSMVENQAVLGQCLDVGSACPIAIELEVMDGIVLGHQKNDIGALARPKRKGAQRTKKIGYESVHPQKIDAKNSFTQAKSCRNQAIISLIT